MANGEAAFGIYGFFIPQSISGCLSLLGILEKSFYLLRDLQRQRLLIAPATEICNTPTIL